MGVFKRYRDAQAALKDAENAMPGAYQSNYTDDIRQTLDSMGAASDAGYDVGTDSELYRQYRGNAQASAQAAAENAAAGAAALSGGYGSSYANSVAQQGYQQAMANVDDGLASLREKALTQYKLKQSGLSQMLSSLLNQDSLEAAQHQTNVTNAQNWLGHKQERAQQAAQEKSDFWGNLLQMGGTLWDAFQTGYDAYKGYSRQKEQDKQTAIGLAAKYYGEGASTEFLDSILSPHGIDSSIFDGWTTEDTSGLTDQQQLNAYLQAASLAAEGNQTAADYILTSFLELPAGSAGTYDDISRSLLATAQAKSS